MRFYEIYDEQSSFFFKTKEQLVGEEEILEYAIKNKIIFSRIIGKFGYIQSISKREFEAAS